LEYEDQQIFFVAQLIHFEEFQISLH